MKKHQLIKKINSIIILLLLGLCLLGCKDNVPLQISAIGAGKTGTIITSKEKEISFCGYFTVDGSLYTCLVIISNPKKDYPSDGIMAENVIKYIVNSLTVRK